MSGPSGDTWIKGRARRERASDVSWGCGPSAQSSGTCAHETTVRDVLSDPIEGAPTVGSDSVARSRAAQARPRTCCSEVPQRRRRYRPERARALRVGQGQADPQPPARHRARRPGQHRQDNVARDGWRMRAGQDREGASRRPTQGPAALLGKDEAMAKIPESTKSSLAAAPGYPRTGTLAPDQPDQHPLPGRVRLRRRGPFPEETSYHCAGCATPAMPTSGASRSTAPAMTTTKTHSYPPDPWAAPPKTPSTPPAASTSPTPQPGPEPPTN
jgi:hypothetical protein